MKYNSCLLDRLYSTKCNYMQIHLLSVTSYAFHAQKKERKKKKMPRIQKKLYILLYENRKYQSKMCTNSLYHVTKNLQYKKTYENDQITHYLEHRGTGTGLVTGLRQNLQNTELLLMNSSQSHFHASLQLDPTDGSTLNTAGSKSDRVKQAN